MSTAQKNGKLNDIHVNSEEVLITPNELRAKLPLSEQDRQFVLSSRQVIANIIHKKDPRLLVISGPCSVHDVEAAKEYGRKLKALQEEYKDTYIL
jgi:3-deoxy-7-phosphoheptulonate synthase